MSHASALGTGYDRVESDVICILTRFRVRSRWSLAKLYRLHRSIRKELNEREIEGLLKFSFLVEDAFTCYTLSFWSHPEAILQFNSCVRSHIRAGNAAFKYLRVDAKGAPELWSAQLRLDAVSPHNMRWEGMPSAGAACFKHVDALQDRAG